MAIARRFVLRLMSLYPPLLGAGVRVRVIARDPEIFETRMKLRWWNRNYVDTHFGGSLYTMCDPFFMLILVEALGPGFVVWDKAAAIRFRRPGRGEVRARFEIPQQRIEAIRAEAVASGRTEPVFEAQVVDAAGEIVAVVEKRISVRVRQPAAAPSTDGG